MQDCGSPGPGLATPDLHNNDLLCVTSADFTESGKGPNVEFLTVCVCVCVYLVLLVLPGVGEAGDDGGDAGRGGNLAGVDHDQQLHQVVVDLAAAALHDVDVLASHALPDLHAAGGRGDVSWRI